MADSKTGRTLTPGSAAAAAKLVQQDYPGRTDGDNGRDALHILNMVAGQESSVVLTDRDRVFLSDMRDKRETAKRTGVFTVSRKQLNWLRDIQQRLLEAE